MFKFLSAHWTRWDHLFFRVLYAICRDDVCFAQFDTSLEGLDGRKPNSHHARMKLNSTQSTNRLNMTSVWYNYKSLGNRAPALVKASTNMSRKGSLTLLPSEHSCNKWSRQTWHIAAHACLQFRWYNFTASCNLSESCVLFWDALTTLLRQIDVTNGVSITTNL